jgi:hypothetical protein
MWKTKTFYLLKTLKKNTQGQYFCSEGVLIILVEKEETFLSFFLPLQ